MLIAVIVLVGIRMARRPAESRRSPDEALIVIPPRPWVHESFVVEAGAEQAAQYIVYRRYIEPDARPSFRRSGDQVVVKLDLCRPEVWQRRGASADLHDGIGFLRPATDDSARAMQLKTSPDYGDTISQ